MTLYRRDRSLGTVIQSINNDHGDLCVDFFRRSSGQFGYENYRRDHESAEGWFPIGFYSNRLFFSLDEAQSDAIRHIEWLSDYLTGRE